MSLLLEWGEEIDFCCVCVAETVFFVIIIIIIIVIIITIVIIIRVIIKIVFIVAVVMLQNCQVMVNSSPDS